VKRPVQKSAPKAHSQMAVLVHLVPEHALASVAPSVRSAVVRQELALDAGRAQTVWGRVEALVLTLRRYRF